MLRFFLFSQLSERYGGGAETALRADFRVLADRDDPPRRSLEDLAKGVAVDAKKYYRGLKVRSDDVSGPPTKNVMLLLMYLLMRQQEATDWARDRATLKDIEPPDMHIHHIFPYNFMMTDKGALSYADRENVKPNEFRALINDISNMTFLRRSTNVKIGDAPPGEYLPQWTTKEMRRAHFIPEDPSLWSTEKFKDFLEARASLVAARATRLLKSLK
jgi:hypothetical protein